MDDFRFTESQWDKISAELGRTGRSKYEGDRQDLEMICNSFTQLRPRLGRGAPTPAGARDAWREVAAAAKKLKRTIDGLRAAGAADFPFLDASPVEAEAKWSAWLVQLQQLKEAATWAAKLEMMPHVRKVSNRSDLLRDGLTERLVIMWKGYGGRISHGNGPLVRFLSAVTAPALIWAGEKAMTTDAVKECVRRIKARHVVS
jgi:hypothetical protein